METAFVGEAYETGMAVYIIYRGGGGGGEISLIKLLLD